MKPLGTLFVIAYYVVGLLCSILHPTTVEGLENLPEPLRQTAGVRLEYPDSSLKELGELMDPPVGKSGVNHRLRKLCELAEKIR